jgi:hypothetical protein
VQVRQKQEAELVEERKQVGEMREEEVAQTPVQLVRVTMWEMTGPGVERED